MTAIDTELSPRLTIIFCPEWHAEALADYCDDCRACPESQLPPFDEYAADWLDARIQAEVNAANAEAADQRAEEARRVFPAPMVETDETPF